jgi:hypothetical protein
VVSRLLVPDLSISLFAGEEAAPPPAEEPTPAAARQQQQREQQPRPGGAAGQAAAAAQAPPAGLQGLPLGDQALPASLTEEQWAAAMRAVDGGGLGALTGTRAEAGGQLGAGGASAGQGEAAQGSSGATAAGSSGRGGGGEAAAGGGGNGTARAGGVGSGGSLGFDDLTQLWDEQLDQQQARGAGGEPQQQPQQLPPQQAGLPGSEGGASSREGK